MARFNRLDVLQRMVKTGLVPVFYSQDLEIARQVASSVSKGGCGLLEFTNRGDHAWEVFSALETFCRRDLPDLMLGVGSIVDAPTAALYINCGANFVVGPVLNADVARLCNRRKIPYSAGCGTASEISMAEELGCEIVKIFPGEQVGGAEFVKAVLGPCPWTSIMPTGGVDGTEASLGAWFKAGVACVGMGSKLIAPKLLAAKDWDGIARTVSEVLAVIRRVRAASPSR